MKTKPHVEKIASGKKPQNAAEGQFFEWAASQGMSLTKKGWPDWFVWTADGKIALVEVKPKHGRKLKKEQLAILGALAEFGVPCYRWSPDGGLVKIKGSHEPRFTKLSRVGMGAVGGPLEPTRAERTRRKKVFEKHGVKWDESKAGAYAQNRT